MPNKKLAGYLVIAIIVLMGLYSWVAYNSIVAKDVAVKQSWSEVQSVYQRRADLVPNLVNVVKGVSGFEQNTLVQVAEARSKALSASSVSSLSPANYNEQVRAQDALTTATRQLIISAEKYPQLKGTAAYSGLQTQLEGTERRIKVARNDFNAAVADYNNAVRSFPKSLVAGMFGFHSKDGFSADAGADKNTEVNFKN